MDEQYDMFRPTGWRQCMAATDAAVAWVVEGANSDWLDFALACLQLTALRRAYLSADEVAGLMAQKALEFTVPETRDYRAMGGVMRLGAKEGWIEATEEFGACRRANQHRCPKRVWRSLIWRDYGNARKPATASGGSGGGMSDNVGVQEGAG